MPITLQMTEEDHAKLRRLLDRAGDKLRALAPENDDEADDLADGLDHWLEKVETLQPSG